MFIEKSLLLSWLPLKVSSIAGEIVNHLLAHNARVYAVGGIVRDILLDVPIHDLDIEVHGMTTDHLEKILASFGTVHYDGKSFGVMRIAGLPIDWSLPRRDSHGRKPLVEIDPSMTITDALQRRDLTMNAMAIDCATGLLIDPFGGYTDLKNKVLAAPDPTFFIQDPLRFYRVMQFVARFEMRPNDELTRICRWMDLSHLSLQRIHAEYDKLVRLSRSPSLGFRWLRDTGRLRELLPELAATQDIPQERDWHPEGDVFEHTMQACDAAAQRAPAYKEHTALLVYASLCHDVGKVTTTKIINGRWRSLGHDSAGVAPARQLCARLTGSKKIIDQVARLVRHHMAPGQFAAQGATAKAYKKLAKILSPDLSLYLLAQLAYADKLGRNPERGNPLSGSLPHIDTFIECAEKYGVLYHPEKPLITGTDLIPLGFQGPALGRTLEKLYEHQLEEKNPTKETLLRYVQRMVK